MGLTDQELAAEILRLALAGHHIHTKVLPRFRSTVENALDRITAAQTHKRVEVVMIHRLRAEYQPLLQRQRELEAEQARRAQAGIPPFELMDPAARQEMLSALQAVTDEASAEIDRIEARLLLPWPANDW